MSGWTRTPKGCLRRERIDEANKQFDEANKRANEEKKRADGFVIITAFVKSTLCAVEENYLTSPDKEKAVPEQESSQQGRMLTQSDENSSANNYSPNRRLAG